MKQKEPAEKCETKKSYISRIEINSSEIQLRDINENCSAVTRRTLKIDSFTLMKERSTGYYPLKKPVTTQ